MRKVVLIIIYSLLTNYEAKASHPSLHYILGTFMELMKDGKVEYESTMDDMDGTKVIAKGVMSFWGSKYYDSSNTRFVFYNDKWYIGADHQDKSIKVINMKSWRKEFGYLGQLDMLGNIATEDTSMFEHARFALENLGKDVYLIHINFSNEDFPLKKLSIKYSLQSKIPLEYNGEMKIPLEYQIVKNKNNGSEKEVAIGYSYVRFSCRNISRADRKMFDHKRLIHETKKGAKLLRYQHYETIIVKNPKM